MTLARCGALSVALGIVFVVPALAQSQADISAKINSALPDNGRGQITASGLRGVMNSFNAARGAPNGIAELGPDGRLVPAQGQTTFTSGNFPNGVSSSGMASDNKITSGLYGAANRGPDASIGPVLNNDGTVTLFGQNTPANGTWTSADASLKCEPILGPFHEAGSDLTRCQSTRYFTATGDENKGEYGTILNMRSNSGFPTACSRNKFYPELGSCVNNGNMYRVKAAAKNGSGQVTQTYYGTTAATGSGPTGTDPNADQVDGGVTWRYDPAFSPGNGGKSNLVLMTYQEANAGAMWTGAFAHQIADGGAKKTAFTLELDLNNYWGDYTQGPGGPTATALQIFTGGPYRSSKAVGIGQYSEPAPGQTSLVNGMEFCCASLVRDNTILDLTGSTNGYMNQGYHAGSAFTDGSNSAVSFNSYGGAGIGFRHTGASGVGLRLDGSYSGFQIQGQNWNVNPVGEITAAGVNVSVGALKPAQYTVAGLFPCVANSKGSVVVVTDLAADPAYRGLITAGGGSISALAFCTGSAWVAH